MSIILCMEGVPGFDVYHIFLQLYILNKLKGEVDYSSVNMVRNCLKRSSASSPEPTTLGYLYMFTVIFKLLKDAVIPEEDRGDVLFFAD